MRDLWYELCEKSEINPDVAQFSIKLDGLYNEFNIVKDNQKKHDQVLNELKIHISSHFQKEAAQFITVDSIDELITASGSTTASIINKPLGDSFEKVCPRCGISIYQTDAIYCYYCGNRL